MRWMWATPQRSTTLGQAEVGVVVDDDHARPGRRCSCSTVRRPDPRSPHTMTWPSAFQALGSLQPVLAVRVTRLHGAHPVTGHVAGSRAWR